MTEQTKQKGMHWSFKWGIVAIIALALGLGIFVTYETVRINSRIESNIQFIETQGFNVQRGYFSNFDPYVRISNVTYWLTLVRNWNVTTIYVDTGDGEMFFIYQGLIYAHW